MNVIEKTITLADGRVITLETGKLAKQADGAVMVKMGNTMLLATVVSAQDAGPDVDFMPLSVDYKEKFASVGRFPGGFTRREEKENLLIMRFWCPGWWIVLYVLCFRTIIMQRLLSR